MQQIIVHSDIDLLFKPHPLTGNVNPKVNIEAIRQSITNLFLLNPYDVPFNPDFHANMKKYLFDPITMITSANIRKRIEWLIASFEKRVKLYSVDVVPNETDNGFIITITYRIKELNIDDSVTHFFQRIR